MCPRGASHSAQDAKFAEKNHCMHSLRIFGHEIVAASSLGAGMRPCRDAFALHVVATAEGQLHGSAHML